MSGIIDDLRSSINGILKIRDDIKAGLKPVYMVTRVWSGSEIGDGSFAEVRKQVLPSPRIVSLQDDYRVREGGAIQYGDVMLKMISKQSYPKQTDVDCSVNGSVTEKYYEIDGIRYRVINVTEKHVVWSVQVRRVSNS